MLLFLLYILADGYLFRCSGCCNVTCQLFVIHEMQTVVIGTLPYKDQEDAIINDLLYVFLVCTYDGKEFVENPVCKYETLLSIYDPTVSRVFQGSTFAQERVHI